MSQSVDRLITKKGAAHLALNKRICIHRHTAGTVALHVACIHPRCRYKGKASENTLRTNGRTRFSAHLSLIKGVALHKVCAQPLTTLSKLFSVTLSSVLF